MASLSFYIIRNRLPYLYDDYYRKNISTLPFYFIYSKYFICILFPILAFLVFSDDRITPSKDTRLEYCYFWKSTEFICTHHGFTTQHLHFCHILKHFAFYTNRDRENSLVSAAHDSLCITIRY